MMASPERPRSPHLQIYRFGWTMSMSIFHRFTGVLQSVGLVLIVAWLMALGSGPKAFASAHAVTSHWLGKLVLAGWSFAFFYHLCNGIRHMCWDLGWGFEIPKAKRSAAAVLVTTVILTAGSLWLAACTFGGGA